ncbi:DNA excision repair protein ERCC-6-like [Babylonia areolata]|uniref:DNA excision repair protein ERCC-6-like n=1 Tax=Babylonia areolata TaxID=304850 RepID=UPI003FD3A141
MQNNCSDSQDADIETTSKKFANLSVCEDRSPLKGIPADSPRIKGVRSSQSSLDDTPRKGSGSELSKEQTDIKEAQVRFNKLVKKAKHLAQEGKVQQALELNREALSIHHHEKLARRIAKMEEYLKNYGGQDQEEEEEMEGGMIQLGSNSGFYLHKDLNSRLYSHQKKGVLWMWGLHKKNKGGILGDDMGLGKTIQVIAFLSGLFDMDKVRTVLIILPVSVMINWEKEFNKWAPGIAVYPFHGTSKRERERNLDRVQRRGGVLLTTYGMVLTSWEQMSQHNGRDFVWDYVILDEGHKIKNASKTTKAVYGVAAKHRIILTGTPIQNNLKELWTLFDYVHQGSLLGTLRTFKMEFENPIIRARERDATGGEKRLGLEMVQSLKKIIDPFFMRRTKAEIKEDEKRAEDSGNPHEKSIRMPTMMFKNDFVVWLYLSDTQLNIYRDFLELASVKELLVSSKSPLVALTVLKKICDHPRLLSLRACHQLGLHGQEMVSDELEMASSLESAVTKIDSIDDEVLMREAGKMGVLVSLVDQLRREEHRALIFSQSRKMLDIIQKVLKNKGHKVMRLDGTVKSVTERDELVQKFQRNSSYSVFLLTTQVGGVGLTLTAADRVIIYDPSWNPATDAQAVDRAFRIGQTKNVVIYRLITCGTVEEKIYRRQIFKDSITRQTTGGTKDPYRYFTKQELRELFQLEEHRFSNTQQQLEEMHGLDRRRDPELDNHIAFLHSLDIFGISDHDLMFSQESPVHETEEDMVPGGNVAPVPAQHTDYIKHRVQKAKEIIERESSVPGTMEQRMKSTFQITSVYELPENRALMKDMPVFQPNASDNPRFVLNRPGAGGGLNVFQSKPSDSKRPILNRPAGNGSKAPQVIAVNPPKPTKTEPQAEVQCEVSCLSSGSSVSDPIDLTVDEDSSVMPGRMPHSLSSQSSSHGEDRSKSPQSVKHQLVNLPKVEKRKKEDSWLQAADSIGQAPSVQAVPQRHETPQPACDKPPSPSPQLNPLSTVPLSPQPSEQKSLPDALTTPMARPQCVVEEELIISPTSYTPLMMMRQKRRKMMDSPVEDLSKAFSASVFVAESPELTVKGRNGSGEVDLSTTEENDSLPSVITSFLADDDLVAIQESFSEDGSKASSPVAQTFPCSKDNTGSGVMEDSDMSEDSEPVEVVKTKRRRSVCRRVAVIESSEDELEDDENKENLDPSFSDASHYNEDKEDEDVIGDEISKEEVKELDADNGEERTAEEEEELFNANTENMEEYPDSDTEEETDATGDAQRSIAIYDDSITENRDEEEEQEVEEEEQEVEEEEQEVEEEEDAVDAERISELLRDGKQLYKQKQYPAALEKCQAALALMHHPELQAMVDKIQGKINQGL